MNPNSKLQHCLFLIGTVTVIGVIALSCRQPTLWSPKTTTHQPSIPIIWELKEIYMDAYKQTLMVATNERLIFIGSDSVDKPSRLIALNEDTGTVIWQYGDNSVSSLAASPDSLFVGEVDKVVALNPDNGEVIWSTKFLCGVVTKVVVRDAILYIDTVRDGHVLLDAETGKIIKSISYSIGGAPNRDVPIWSDHNMNVEFVGRTIYFQKQTGFPDYDGEIVATDELTGSQLWKFTLRAASRIAVSPLGIFVLDWDGNLLKLDPQTGIMNNLIEFTPPPIPRYHREGGGSREYGFQVAVDTDSQLLFVYLGDSAQLYAFQLPIASR